MAWRAWVVVLLVLAVLGPAAAQNQQRIEGNVTQVHGNGVFYISSSSPFGTGFRVQGPIVPLVPGDRVAVYGTLGSDRVFRATRVEVLNRNPGFNPNLPPPVVNPNIQQNFRFTGTVLRNTLNQLDIQQNNGQVVIVGMNAQTQVRGQRSFVNDIQPGDRVVVQGNTSINGLPFAQSVRVSNIGFNPNIDNNQGNQISGRVIIVNWDSLVIQSRNGFQSRVAIGINNTQVVGRKNHITQVTVNDNVTVTTRGFSNGLPFAAVINVR